MSRVVGIFLVMLSLAAEPITHVGTITITNTMLNTLLVDAILIGFALYFSRIAAIIPNRTQGVVELIFAELYNLTETVAGKQTMQIFPWVMTFFLFILVANWSGLIPVLGALGVFYHTEQGKELIPLFRSTSTDLNTTLALALISLVTTHTMSIRTLGLKQYIGRFLSFNPGALFSGLLELVSELTKVISFSFRLFGNIFVGEVILGLLSAISAFLLPIPIIFYELFVGAVQATIFALLTMAFMAIFTSPHGEEAH